MLYVAGIVMFAAAAGFTAEVSRPAAQEEGPDQEIPWIEPSTGPATGGQLPQPEPQAQQNAPSAQPSRGVKYHKVWLWQESRECLWNLAKKYYGDPWLWKKIYLANKQQISDPRIIYPKQVLVIPPLDASEK